MRDDEKIDPLLELEVQKDQVEELEQEEQPDQVVAEEVDTSAMHFHELGEYIEALLAGEEAELELDWLTDLEREALDLLEHAIGGRREGGSVIYAEDRLRMLNLALAALQPVLARGFETQEIEAHELYRVLVEDIADFQKSLESLSDAQEELLTRELLERLREGERPGKPKPVDAGEVGDNRPSQLAAGGPAAPDFAPAPSQLATGGPAAPEFAPAPSQLATGGPAAPDFAPAPSQLATGGPPAPDKKPQPSTAWDGDDRRR